MRRTIISLSKFLFVVSIVSGLCVASLPPPAMAEPPTPTPPHPRPRYEGLEEWPHRALTVPQAAPQGNVASTQFVPWSKLVFQSYRDDNWEIYLANGDGSNQARLTYDSAADIHPRLNRGCTRIAFASKRTGNYEIFTMNPDGSGLWQLTANSTDDGNPSWSPDGTRIAFEAYRDGQSEIYVMNADGSGQTRLTWDGAYDGEPAWSPGGTRIAFTSRRNGGYAIWVMNADGSGQTQLSTQPYSENPAWSPDGTQIAYDSDGDGDGWQELWLMNADGSNQRQVYDPGGYQTDAWAKSWSPDGRYVAFARISWIYYEGNLYWTEAYLDAWDSANPWNTIRLSSQGTDWHPDWQTTDAWAPTSSVNALPAQSPGPFTVRWSGYDNGPSGLKSYDVQVKDGTGGAWTDWQTGTTATSASYPGVGGYTYYFRSRARDNAYNVEPWPPDYDTLTTVEALPPRTAVEPLPAYCRGEVTVRWGGGDPGGSGIQTYDVQYQDTAAGSWTDWQVGTTETSASFSGTAGHTYYFRSRARDKAQNVEPWPLGDGDASTMFYAWAVIGMARDNTDIPVAGVIITTTPAALAVIPSDASGAYAAYFATSASAFAATWGKSGYGALPATVLSDSVDINFDVVLPPADNVVHNWDFEDGSLGPGNWLASGVITPVVTSSLKHTGDYAAFLGRQFTFGLPFNVSNNAGGSINPQLAVDGSRAVHVVWQDNTPGYYPDIFYARRASDGTWSSPQNISTTPGFSENPQLAVDQGGSVHVVWEDTTPGNYEIFYARRSSDGTWSSPQDISNNPCDSRHPQLAVDESGAVHVVWDEYILSGYDYYDIYYAGQGSDGTWSSPQNISNNPGGSVYPQLVVDKEGAVHVVWKDHIGQYTDIFYARRSSDGTWSSPQNISNTPSISGLIDQQLLAVDRGSVHVVWQDDVGPPWHTEIFHAKRSSDGTWSSPQNVSNNPGYSGTPQLAIDEIGAVHLVWNDLDQNGWRVILYARRSSDGTWSSPQNISSTPGPSESPRLAVDGGGTVHLVWQDSIPGNDEIFYAKRSSDGTWSSPQNISNNPGSNSLAPGLQLAVDGGGVVHVVWQDDTTGNLDIYYVRSSRAEEIGDSTIAQAVTVPITMANPTLSLFYQLAGVSPTSGTWFDVQVDSTTTLFSTTTSSDTWTHRWFDLTPWTGQAITLTFTVHQTAGQPNTWAYLDEASLGSAYPDLWVSKNGPALVLPGEQVVYTIAYGNRGGAAASGVRITDTLPAELSFVDASPLPVTTLPLVWEVGDVPAKSGSFTIAVTTTVDPAATSLTTLTNTVSIGVVSPELETFNNTAQAATFIGHRIYLPVLMRGYFE